MNDSGEMATDSEMPTGIPSIFMRDSLELRK